MERKATVAVTARTRQSTDPILMPIRRPLTTMGTLKLGDTWVGMLTAMGGQIVTGPEVEVTATVEVEISKATETISVSDT